MKYINKFIVAGLGFALMFTGTSFVHGMFTSTAVQENIVMVPKANIVVDTNNKPIHVIAEEVVSKLATL